MQYTYSANPKVKNAAARITRKLGLPISKAIDLYLHAIINQKGIPFPVKLNPRSQSRNFFDRPGINYKDCQAAFKEMGMQQGQDNVGHEGWNQQ